MLQMLRKSVSSWVSGGQCSRASGRYEGWCERENGRKIQQIIWCDVKGLKMKPIFSCACLLSFFMVDLTTSSSSVGLLDVLDSFTQVMTGTDGKYNRLISIKPTPDNTNIDLILIIGRLSSTLLQPCGSLTHTCMSPKMLHGKDW